MKGGHPAERFTPLRVARPDQHGNTVAHEGCDRCRCGSKYWEHDRCVDCGGPPPGLN